MKSSAVSPDLCLEIAWNVAFYLFVPHCLLQPCKYLINWQKDLERYSLIGLQLMCELLDVRLSRILAQCAEALSDLLLLNFSIASVIKQVEGFLEF